MNKEQISQLSDTKIEEECLCKTTEVLLQCLANEGLTPKQCKSKQTIRYFYILWYFIQDECGLRLTCATDMML